MYTYIAVKHFSVYFEKKKERAFGYAGTLSLFLFLLSVFICFCLSHSHTHPHTHTLCLSLPLAPLFLGTLAHVYRGTASGISGSHTRARSLSHLPKHTHTLVFSLSLYIHVSLPLALLLIGLCMSSVYCACVLWKSVGIYGLPFRSLALSLTHTYTHTHTLSLPLTHTHSLPLFIFLLRNSVGVCGVCAQSTSFSFHRRYSHVAGLFSPQR